MSDRTRASLEYRKLTSRREFVISILSWGHERIRRKKKKSVKENLPNAARAIAAMSVQCLMFAKIETEKLASFSTTSTTTSTTTSCSLPLLLRLVFLHLLLFRVLLLVRLSPHVAAGAPNRSGPLRLSRRRLKETIHLPPAPSSSSSSSCSESSFCSTLVSGSTERSQIPRARLWHRSSRSSIGST